MSTVLVTGGSGFVGSHCIVHLLAAGHQVRTTVRNLKREPEVREMLMEGGVKDGAGDRLSFFAADLENDAGWSEAIAGCDYVLHVASPFPSTVPRHEDELIIPAREGALRVLRALRDAQVKRVVLTSSFAAIGYGHPGKPSLSTKPTGPTPTATTFCRTPNRKPSPSAPRGISSPRKAALWSSPSSTRWAFSARSSALTSRLPSYWSSA